MSIVFLYGALQKHVDVTEIAKSIFIRGTDIVIENDFDFNHMFGDVYPNQFKQLTIRYGDLEIVLPEQRNNRFSMSLETFQNNPKYSVLITSYECHGNGCIYLRHNLDILMSQTYRPLQVVVSDHSKDNGIESMIQTEFLQKAKNTDVDLVYTRYTENYGNPCANWNNAAKYAAGDLWHFFALDDFLANADSIKNVVAAANENLDENWFVCSHQVYPYGGHFRAGWNNNILQKNSISGPSAVVLRKKLHYVLLDPQFIWFLDLDWYYRLYIANDCIGACSIPTVIWINRYHDAQLSNTVCDDVRQRREKHLLIQKYGYPFPTSVCRKRGSIDLLSLETK